MAFAFCRRLKKAYPASLVSLALALCSCSDYLQTDPIPEIAGIWHATRIDPVVFDVLRSSEVLTPVENIEISLTRNQRFSAENVPYSLSWNEAEVFSGTGRWEIVDSRMDQDLLKYELRLTSDDNGLSISYEFHEDSSGIYFEEDFNLDADTGIEFRKIIQNKSVDTTPASAPH